MAVKGKGERVISKAVLDPPFSENADPLLFKLAPAHERAPNAARTLGLVCHLDPRERRSPTSVLLRRTPGGEQTLCKVEAFLHVGQLRGAAPSSPKDDLDHRCVTSVGADLAANAR